MKRREFIKAASALPIVSAANLAPGSAWAQQKPFSPQPGRWRHYEVVTQVEILKSAGVTRLWLPVPSIDSEYQRSLETSYKLSEGGTGRIVEDGKYAAKILVVEFPAGAAKPTIEQVSRFQTQDRAIDWSKKSAAREDPAVLKMWLQPTDLMPTDGIVLKTAQEAARGKSSDRDKAQAIYDWVVTNTFREPKTRGCGVGDIKAMLESGNLSGKCADLNALFVGMSRAVGIPARDVYGLRLAPSAFGYKALSANSANVTRAQHCRAEVYLAGYGGCRQGDARRDLGMDQDRVAPDREPGQARLVRHLGRQLARLQPRARCRAARREGAEDRLLHVSERRDRERAPRQPRS
jgi:transglutaminase-like putative cysteine protease